MIRLVAHTFVGFNDALRRAGWRLGMFGGVVLGGLLASFISPPMTGAVTDTFGTAASVQMRYVDSPDRPGTAAARGHLHLRDGTLHRIDVQDLAR